MLLYRFCVAAIVGFWLLMAATLARTVWFRGDARPVPVPVEYVGHLIFRHELPSDLVLYWQHRRADGNFHLQPKRLTANNNLLGASGNFPLALPGMSGQRVVLHGALEFDDREQVRRMDFSINVHEPKSQVPGVTLHVDGEPAANRWHYQLTQAGTMLREGSGTPQELLAALSPQTFGFDPHVIIQSAPRPSAITVTAQRGKLHVNEDDIDTYLVTIHQGEGLETTIHVNQVGQVLAVKTFLGFELYDETLSP